MHEYVQKTYRYACCGVAFEQTHHHHHLTGRAWPSHLYVQTQQRKIAEITVQLRTRVPNTTRGRRLLLYYCCI